MLNIPKPFIEANFQGLSSAYRQAPRLFDLVAYLAAPKAPRLFDLVAYLAAPKSSPGG